MSNQEPNGNMSRQFSKSKMLAAFAGNETLVRKLLLVFLLDAPELMSQLCAAIEQGELYIAARHAHHLKTLLANLRAEPTRTLTERIEHSLSSGQKKSDFHLDLVELKGLVGLIVDEVTQDLSKKHSQQI